MDDITLYPQLHDVLVDVINVHWTNLKNFRVFLLPPTDRQNLIDAYKQDAEVGEIEALLLDNDIHAEIAKGLKDGIDSSIAVDNILKNRIFDIAQEMGPSLERIERWTLESHYFDTSKEDYDYE